MIAIQKLAKRIIGGVCLFLAFGLFQQNVFATVEIPDSIHAFLDSDDPRKQVEAYRAMYEQVNYRDPEEAIKFMDEAISIATDNEMLDVLVPLYINTGVAYIEMNNYAQAENYYQLALDVALELNDTVMLPSIYGNFGNINMHRGKFDKAIELFIKAHDLFEQQGNEKGQLMALGALGNLNLHIEDHVQAIGYYEKAQKRFAELKDTVGSATSLMNIGICYRRLNELDKAQEKYELAYEQLMEIGYLKIAAQCLANMAAVCKLRNQLDKSLEYTTEAYHIFEEYGDSLGKGTSLIDIGAIYLMQKDYIKALEKFQEAYDIVKNSEHLISINDLLVNLVEVYDSLGMYEDAFEHSLLLIDLRDSLYNSESREKLLELRSEFDVAQKEKEIEIQNLLIEKQNDEVERYKQQRWFLVILIVLFILMVWLQYNRIKLKQRHKEENLMRKNVETEQHLLRSQMNPHFIFNSLNSIQGLISSNETYHAEVYLSKFARLVRSILENSKKPTVSLTEDVSNLKLYLDLESMRFGDSFEYRLSIAGDINQEEAMVPPLMVQPFTENSIKHGMMKMKDKKGLMKIDYHREGEYLVCIVEDNGIGREASYKLKDKGSNHKSLGMKVTQERLDSLNKQLNTHANSEIIDLYDENGVAQGTKVVLKVPYQNL